MFPVIITHEELLLHMGRQDRILRGGSRSICEDDDRAEGSSDEADRA
ncbi:hypothetical protein LOK74_04050 [Brevibacillus humidisoli]|nr:hypothetical protein [Brevibacillus humidisoli]UFJ41696.1 hypothetical protein LOK74_04050 [Brevibacillus humidisoli]